jgi:hypothetical protein
MKSVNTRFCCQTRRDCLVLYVSGSKTQITFRLVFKAPREALWKRGALIKKQDLALGSKRAQNSTLIPPNMSPLRVVDIDSKQKTPKKADRLRYDNISDRGCLEFKATPNILIC